MPLRSVWAQQQLEHLHCLQWQQERQTSVQVLPMATQWANWSVLRQKYYPNGSGIMKRNRQRSKGREMVCLVKRLSKAQYEALSSDAQHLGEDHTGWSRSGTLALAAGRQMDAWNLVANQSSQLVNSGFCERDRSHLKN